MLPVAIVSSIGAALAAVQVIAEHFLADYGPCRISVNQQRELVATGGASLLSVLAAQKVFVPSACGGRGTCGLCKLRVVAGAGPLLPTEEPFLADAEKQQDVRLACQVKVRGDLQIEVAPELLSVREYRCKCAEITDLTADIKQFRLELLEPRTMDYTPGQYIQLLVPAYRKSVEEVYRAYSISSDPAEKGSIELIIRLVPGGVCTTYCFEYLKAGDEVRINGPYGDFGLSDTDAPIVFVAGGSGMAPIKCMLHQMKNTDSKRKAVFYFGANKPEGLFLVDLMRQFERQLADFRFVPVVCEPQDSAVSGCAIGLVTEAVRKDLRNAAGYEAYLCGSPGMIDSAVAVLKELGAAEDKIFYDKF